MLKALSTIITGAKTHFLNLEGALEKLRDLECTTWVGSDEDLDSVLEKLTQDSISYEKQYLKVQRDNDDILEICNTIIAASKPAAVTRPRNTQYSAGTAIPGDAVFSHSRVHMEGNSN